MIYGAEIALKTITFSSDLFRSEFSEEAGRKIEKT